jgi:23S rRNA (cytosine1962-C5)-methyltransferase
MSEYELIDSGEGEKLERIGSVVVRRPDPEALWHKSSISMWDDADITFDRVDSKTGSWRKKAGSKTAVPDAWQIEHGGLHFHIRPTSFKHVGIFPEQISNWEFMMKAIANTAGASASNGAREKINVLNLFGYTGGATLAAAKAGAEVTHVDASKPVIEWAKENAELNKLSDAPIRWIIDDALVFVKREVKRGKKYDGIVMDPPAFGRGPDGETWKIEEQFLELFDACRSLLSDKPLFFIISGYASGYSALAFGNCLKQVEEQYGGETQILELILKENSTRSALLPAGVTARWKA